MTKTRLLLRPHKTEPGESVVDILYDQNVLGTVTGAEGPCVSVITKYPVHALIDIAMLEGAPNTCTVRIGEAKKTGPTVEVPYPLFRRVLNCFVRMQENGGVLEDHTLLDEIRETLQTHDIRRTG